MNQRQTIQSNIAYLQYAARDLAHYRPRQWADVQMCRDFALWYIKFLLSKQ